jgi:hypothetical protein
MAAHLATNRPSITLSESLACAPVNSMVNRSPENAFGRKL